MNMLRTGLGAWRMNDSWEDTARRCFRWEERERRERKKAKKLEEWERKKEEAPYYYHSEGGSIEGGSEGGPIMTPRQASCLWGGAKFAGLWLFFGMFLGGVSIGLLAASGTLLAIRYLPPRLRISRRLAAFRAGEPGTVLDVYRFAAEEFRGRINAHRARTLGSKSEWAAARDVLAQATDDADRSVAYWRNRQREEPSDEVISGQLRTATELNGRLRSALGKLDGRADVLHRFYNECEAKISAMDRYNSDIEESRRLDRLSGTAGMAIAGPEATLTAIGASFVRDAQKIGEVFVNFERLQLGTLAGEVPLDNNNIEVLADRINTASESKYATVEELSRVIEDLEEPIAP